MGTPKLLPCPCCGMNSTKRQEKTTYCQLHGDPIQNWRIECRNCGLRMTGTNLDVLAERWNRRAPISADGAVSGYRAGFIACGNWAASLAFFLPVDIHDPQADTKRERGYEVAKAIRARITALEEEGKS